jgi:hypothetical protein
MIASLADAVSSLKAPPAPDWPNLPPPSPPLAAEPTANRTAYRDVAAGRKLSTSNHAGNYRRNSMSSLGNIHGIQKRQRPSFDNNAADDNNRPSYRDQEKPMRNEGRRYVVGRAQIDGPVKGGIRTCQLFIYRVEKNVSFNDMKNFLKNHVHVEDLQIVSHEDARFKSFRLTVRQADVDKLFDEYFWPQNVGCKYFRRFVRNDAYGPADARHV